MCGEAVTLAATALLCLSLNLYYESRSLPVMDQYAVAMVTMNRAKGKSQNVCREVFKPYQFSWTNDGAAMRQGGHLILSSNMKPAELDAWDKSTKISKAVLAGRMPDFTFGSTHYHLKRVHPAWAKTLKRTKSFGPHVFYREHKSPMTIIAWSGHSTRPI